MAAVACTKCGKTHPNKARSGVARCPHCGHDLGNPAQAAPLPPSPRSEAPTFAPGDSAPTPPKKQEQTQIHSDGESVASLGQKMGAAPTHFDARQERGLHPPGYEVLAELGRGGMGVVYKARQAGLNRIVALKMILAGGHAGPDELARFRTEAEAMARLQHPGIVAVHEVGEHDGKPYFSLEFCAGGSLEQKLRGQPLTAQAAAQLTMQLAQAMHAAHQANVIHRDLKPANILLQGIHHRGAEDTEKTKRQKTESDKDNSSPLFSSVSSVPLWCNLSPKITDFGLAKKLDEHSQTQTGSVMGTPSYMAPEQAEGKKTVGPAADVYSLGAILYECLTGRPPFRAATPFDTILQVVSDEPVPPSQLNARVPADLETIALKTLQKEPKRRYATADDLAEDLRRYLAGEPIRARPIGPAERLVRWCRKRPAVAALTAAVFLLLTAVAVVACAGYVRTDRARIREAEQRQVAENLQVAAEEQRAAAQAAEEKARAEQREAETQRAAAQTAGKQARDEAARARQLLYAANVQLAGQMWGSEQGSARRIDDLLDGWTGQGEDLREFAWRFQWGLLHDAPGILRGHQGAVQAGAIRSDGKVVTIDEAMVLRCWDRSGKELARAALREAKETARIDLAANGSVAAALIHPGVIRLVDPATGQIRHRLEAPGGQANHLRLTPDGKLLVARRSDGTAWVWDAASGKLVNTFVKTAAEFDEALAFSSDGLLLAILGGSSRVQVGLVDLQKKISRGPLPANVTVSCLAFSADGKQLAGGNWNGKIILWNVAPFRETMRRAVHLGTPTCAAFSDNGKQLASGTADGEVAVTDLADGKTIFRGKGHTARVTFVSLSLDGKWLVSGSADGTARVWPLTSPSGSRLLYHSDRRVSSLACSPDGKWLASALGPTVRMWDARTIQFVRELALPRRSGTGRAGPIAFTSDSKTLAVGYGDGSVRLWNVEAGGRLRTLESIAPPSKQALPTVTALAFSPDGRFLVVGHGTHHLLLPPHNQVVHVWDVRSGKMVQTLAHDNTVCSLIFSADGKLLFSGCAGGKVRTWSVPNWKPDKTWTTPNRIASLALSPRNDLLAAGLVGGAVHVWEVGSAKQALVMNEHLRNVVDLAFTPDGKTLVSTSQDRTVRLWHVFTGRSLLVLHGHENFLSGLAVTPDGNTIVSADRDGFIRLWQAPSLARIESSKPGGRRR